MVQKKKGIHPSFILLGALISVYLGYLINGAWKKGIGYQEFMNRLNTVMETPIANYYNSNTSKAMVIALSVYIIALLIYITSKKNYMPGKEYGTATFANISQVNKMIADKEQSFNRILSQNVRMSLNTRKTKLNNNVLIIGGSGAGKTFYTVKPNLMQMPQHCSFILTDPKAEILRSCGEMLKQNGYKVRVINLLEMEKSDGYNPFAYIREETDVIKLITNLIANTTPKGSNSADPFWERSESLFLQAIFYYVWLQEPMSRRNFETVLELLGEAEVTEPNKPSKLDERMHRLEFESPLGCNHPALKQYNKCMRGAGDTVRSIIISANSRLAFLENKQVLRILARDEMNLAELGLGVNGDGETRTAIFCVTPDSDKSYNFLLGLFYTQVFQELYYQADFNCGGRLPIHVTLMLDEFANIALPDDFCSLLSTMRSREISSVIIIQNLAQIKALFKDTWETIVGNCDSLVYLGGNEASTHKFISELLGKGTIDKKSSGETKGRQGSSSRNYDVLGRELLTPDEARKLDNKKCLIFIRGFDPIIDSKFIPFGHHSFSQTSDGKGNAYVHVPISDTGISGPPFEFLSPSSVKYYEKRKEKGDNVYIDTLNYEEFQMLDHVGIEKRFTDQWIEMELSENSLDQQNIGNRLDNDHKDMNIVKVKSPISVQRLPIRGADTITNRMIQWKYSKEQTEELKHALRAGIPDKEIMDYFYPDTVVEEMQRIRNEFVVATVTKS